MGFRYRTVRKNLTWRMFPPSVKADEYSRLKHCMPRECLIVLGPAIGDYVFTRNYIEELRKSKRFKGYKLVLLCDRSWEGLARYLDDSVIDIFLSYDEHVPCSGDPDIIQAERIRRRLVRKGLKNYYDTILMPSMCFGNIPLQPIHEHILSGVTARERIGFYFMLRRELAAKKSHYTRIIPAYCNLHSRNIFEHLRLYFESVLGEKILLQVPRIDESLVREKYENNRPYIIIQAFISSEFRGDKMWHPHNWESLILEIKQKFDVDFVLLCAENEKKDAEYLKRVLELEGVAVKLMAGLQIPKLMAVIKGSSLYVGLDTGLFHIAANMKKKAICLSSGRTIRLFLAHYEKESHVRVILPAGWMDWWKSMAEATRMSWPSNTYVVNAITAKEVFAVIEKMLH